MAPKKIHDIDFCRRHIYDSFALTLRISTHSPHIHSLFSPHFPDRFPNKLFMRRTKFGGKKPVVVEGEDEGGPSKKKKTPKSATMRYFLAEPRKTEIIT